MKNLIITIIIFIIGNSYSIQAQKYFQSDFEGTWALDDALVHLGENNKATFQWQNGKTIHGKWNYWGTDESGDKLNIYTDHNDLKLLIKTKSLIKINLVTPDDKVSYSFTRTTRKIGERKKKRIPSIASTRINTNNTTNSSRNKRNPRVSPSANEVSHETQALSNALIRAGSSFFLNALLGGNNNQSSNYGRYHSDARTNQYMREQHIQESRERER